MKSLPDGGGDVEELGLRRDGAGGGEREEKGKENGEREEEGEGIELSHDGGREWRRGAVVGKDLCRRRGEDHVSVV